MTGDPTHFERDALRYLLEPLSEEERARFETRLLEKDDCAEALIAIEDELIDRYLRGELDSTQRAGFEQILKLLPGRAEKIAFARTLLPALDGLPRAAAMRQRSPGSAGARPAPTRRWNRTLAYGAMAAVACVLAVLLLRAPAAPEPVPRAAPVAGQSPHTNQPGAPAVVPPAPAVRSADEPEARPVMLAMALSGTRAASLAHLALPAAARTVVLQLDLEGETGYGAFSARLLSTGGAVVWSAARVVPDTKAGLLELHLPATALSPGMFRLAIGGLEPRSDNAPPATELAALPLQIVLVPARP